MCNAMEDVGPDHEVHTTKLATAGQTEIGVLFNTLVAKADEVQNAEVLRAQRRRCLGQNPLLHAQATVRR